MWGWGKGLKLGRVRQGTQGCTGKGCKACVELGFYPKGGGAMEGLGRYGDEEIRFMIYKDHGVY